MADDKSATVSSHAKSSVAKDLFILRELVSKDFKIKYRRSVLGVAWSVLNPLLMMIVMSIVFTSIFAAGRGGSVPPELYPLYLIVGNVTFSLMNEGTSTALMSIVGAAPLLKKVKVHRWVFPIQKVLFALVNYAFSLIAVALVMLWFRVLPTWHFVWLPLALLLLLLFCAGLGLMLSALTVFFRDVMHLWSVVITAWTYFTPIFWDTNFIATMHPAVRIAMLGNPMYNYLTFMRDIFLYHMNPDPKTLVMCVGWAVVSLIVGYAVFHRTEHKFILYI